MNACRCTSLRHPEHLGCVCEKMATEPDGYRQSCHDHHDAATAALGRSPGIRPTRPWLVYHAAELRWPSWKCRFSTLNPACTQ